MNYNCTCPSLLWYRRHTHTHTHTLLKVLHWIGAFFNLVFLHFYIIVFFQLRAIGAAQLGSEMRRLRRHPAGKLTHNLHPPFLHWFTILILILIVVVVVVVKLPRNMILIICTGMHRDARPRKASPAPPCGNLQNPRGATENISSREFLSFPRWKMLRPAHPWFKQLF